MSVFYNFGKNSSLYRWYDLKKSSLRGFKKFYFNQSSKLTAYRNTTRNELLTEFLKEFYKFCGKAL